MDEDKQLKKQEAEGWGLEKLAYPKEVGYISSRWDLCIGCGYCEMACSMFHYGIINRELSRILHLLFHLFNLNKAS